MTKAELDYILGTMLDSNKNVSDLNITVDKPLQVESSGELVAVEGRKIFTVGRCFRGDVLTAEAEGLFISIDMASYERLHVARDAASRGAR